MGNMLDRALGGSVVPSSPSDPDSGSVTPARVTHLDYAGPRVSAVTENGLLRSVTYDAHGNETSYIATRTYLPRHNLLWKIEDGGEGVDHHVVTYQYDGRGVRVVRTETPVADPNGWAAQRTFVYSPELQLLSVTADDRPNLWGKRAVTNDVFIPRYDLVYFAGQPVAQIDGATGAVRYTFTDHLGTPLLQTSANAAVIWQAEYEPFGNVWQMRTGGFAEQPLRFPGQDVATTWEGSEENYNIFRWYRSGWGRYTQADPLGRSNVNGYAYAYANPLEVADPYGLFEVRYSLTERPAADPTAICGSPMACSLVSAAVTCNCHCDQASGRAVADDVTLRVVGDIRYYSGPMRGLRQRPLDRTVVDSRTAIAHEYGHHIQPAVRDVAALIAPLEERYFDSVEQCRSECGRVSISIGTAFARALAASQAAENAGRRP